MALPSRPMHVPAGLPLDEATRQELLDVGRANVANRNVRNNERGALEKRLGFDPEPVTRFTGADRAAGRRLFAQGQSYGVIDGSTLDLFVESLNTSVNFGRVPEATYSLLETPSPSGSVYVFDTEYCNGFIAVAAGPQILGAGYVSLVEAETGAQVSAPTRLGGEGAIFLASFGTSIVAVAFDVNTPQIDGFILDTTNLAAGWVSLFTVAAPAVVFPAVCSLDDRIALIYATDTGSHRVTVATYNAAGIIGSSAISTASVTPDGLDISGRSADLLWPLWSLSTTLHTSALTPTTLGVVAPDTTIRSGLTNARFCRIAASTVASQARFWVSDATATFPVLVGNVVNTAGTLSTNGNGAIYNLLPCSRPFCRDGRFFMMAAPSPSAGDVTGNTQALCVLVDWTTKEVVRPIANVEPGLAPHVAIFGKVVALDAYRYAYGFSRLKSGRASFAQLFSGNGTTSTALAILDFNDPQRWRTVDHGDVTFIGGGVLSTFDGSRVTEAGFISRPPTPRTSLSGTGITGDFRYVAIYEDVDASGNWVVSGISDPSDVVTAANQKVTVEVPPLTVTSRAQPASTSTVRVAIYRTLDTGEPPYYRLAAVDNDPTDDLIEYEDVTSSTTLASNAKLYAPSLPGTVGESLDRRAPAGLKHVISYAGMLVGAKGGSLVYSGQPVYGEATWFSPVFEVPVFSEDITALAALDGSIFVFREGAIGVVAGEIPSDNGASGGIGQLRTLATDVGCINADSIVVTALGIFFQSHRGLELLTRSQTVEWIGEPIGGTLAAYPNITSAVLDPRNSVVRFSLAEHFEAGGDVAPYFFNIETGASGGGKDLVFDLALKAWISVDDKTDSEINAPSQHAALVGGRYVWLSAGGVVHVETDNHLDDGAWVPASYTLPPWKLGLQQDHRIFEMMLLFEQVSAAGLTIEVAEDYGAFGAVTADKVWTQTDMVAVVAESPEVGFCPRDTGFACQVRISDTEPAAADLGTGAGFIWIGMSADIAPKQGSTRGTPRLNPTHRR